MVFITIVPAFAVEARANETTVGILTIFAYTNGEPPLTERSHAFISFKNFTGESITVGGLSVGRGKEITIGTWGNKSGHNGIWYNLESYYANTQGAYSTRVSLSMEVTRSQVNVINNLIRTKDFWTPVSNCSSFAVQVWNSVSTTELSAGIPNTPNTLITSIKSKPNYETRRAIQYSTPFGYVSNNIFYSVLPADFGSSSLSSVGGGSEAIVVDDAFEVVNVTTPFDMNPYSN